MPRRRNDRGAPRLTDPAVQLQLARQAAVILAGRDPLPLAPRDAALLAWLALEGPTSRSQLAALLWPDAEPDAARNALRQRLFQLRRQCGRDLVGGSTVLALADDLQHDLDEADIVLGDARLAIGAEFDAWLEQQRGCRRSRLRQSLVERCTLAERGCDWAEALGHARELQALEPLSEDAHRRVMRLHYLAGDSAAALLAFDACERMLKDDVGARPSAETLALLRTIESAGPAPLAGASSPVPASVVRPPRLIGRELELAALRQGWEAAQVVALIGEAGLGKTRLLQAFMEGQPGAVRAAGRPGDAGVPFATLARLLRAVIALGSQASAALLPAPTRNEIARVLPEFDAMGGRHAGEGQRLVLQRAVRGLLASQPALTGLVVDDLHFADEASLEMLRALIDGSDDDGEEAAAQGSAGQGTAPPVRRALHWALAYRPAEAGSPVLALHDGLVEQARLAPIALPPLDEAALAALVDSLALPGIDGRALAPGLLRRTGGNPLFVLETLKQSWVENTLAQLADASVLPRPVSVGLLIERRVARLSPAALALARVASIAGVDFGIDMAEHVLGASAMQFADALNELESAQVLRGTQFAHDLVFDAVRAGVPSSIARHTHGKVAHWLEQHAGEPARVARHWLDAEQAVRALPWLERAAAAAGAALRVKEQVVFLKHKSAIEEAAGDRNAAFATLMRAAEAQVTIDGEDGAGEAVCDRLVALAGDAPQRVRAIAQRAHLACMRGDLATAEQLAAGALRDALRHAVDPALVVECRQPLATALTLQDRASEAIVQYEASSGWIDEHGDDHQRCELHANLATAYDNCGRLADAVPHHETGITLAQRTGHQNNLAMCLGNYAANRILGGHLGEGEALLLRGRLVRAQADDPSSIEGHAAMLQAICDYQSGRYRAALRSLGTSEEQLVRFAPGFRRNALTHQAVCWAHLGQWARLGQLLAELGDPAQWAMATRMRLSILQHEMEVGGGRRPGVAALAQVLALARPEELPDMRHALQIRIAASLEPEEGLRQLQLVIDAAATLGHDGNVIAAHARAARLAADAGQAETARRHARAALDLAMRSSMVRQYPAELWLDCGIALAACGDTEAAAAVVAQGAAWVRTVAREEVPDEFRHSFLERNPVNRELLALAARRV